MCHFRTSYFSCVTAAPLLLLLWCSCGSQVVPLFYFYRDGVLVAKFPTRDKEKILEAINKYSSLTYEHVSTDDSVPKIPERNRWWWDGDMSFCSHLGAHSWCSPYCRQQVFTRQRLVLGTGFGWSRPIPRESERFERSFMSERMCHMCMAADTHWNQEGWQTVFFSNEEIVCTGIVWVEGRPCKGFKGTALLGVYWPIHISSAWTDDITAELGINMVWTKTAYSFPGNAHGKLIHSTFDFNGNNLNHFSIHIKQLQIKPEWLILQSPSTTIRLREIGRSVCLHVFEIFSSSKCPNRISYFFSPYWKSLISTNKASTHYSTTSKMETHVTATCL